MNRPYLFDEFFASGLEESISPFLTETSRGWGKNLSLKTSLFSAVLFAFAFGLSFVSLPISYILLSGIYFLVGIPSLISAAHDIKNLEINIDVLMTLAAFVAILMGSSFEGALLLVLFNLSHAMEESVSKKTRSALHHLNTIAPKFAFLLDEKGSVYEKAVRDVILGEKLLVKHGEIIPLDGVILQGTSSLNLVHLTGESLPISKTVGDSVPAGARNLESAITIEVSRISADSTLSKIIQLIIQAQEAKPRLQGFLDRFGKHYASAIIILTFLFACTLPFALSIPYFGDEGSIYRALAFLIAASPCALIIATPTAYLSAISACARRGILLKGGITLDALAKCSTIAFDKTGTLTTGLLQCVEVSSFGVAKTPLPQALAIAYSLERHVVHPIATAICSFVSKQNITPFDVSEFKTIPGIGLEGVVENVKVTLGKPETLISLFPENQQSDVKEWVLSLKKDTQIMTALFVHQTLDFFLFQFSDLLRPEAHQLLHKIREKNRLHPIMLTGDHETSAQVVGKALGITDVFFNLRPEDKLQKISDLALEGHLAMVGDGMNDAPALARASVGISMGKVGSATAIDASDVVLLNDDIHLISWVFSKAKSTQRVIKQNLVLALSVICFATLPALLGFVPLWVAVILHEGGTVLVGLNSLRLMGRK